MTQLEIDFPKTLRADSVKYHWTSVEKSLKNIVVCCCSVAKSCLSLCDAVDCNTPGFPDLHYLGKFAQTHVQWASDAKELIVFSRLLRKYKRDLYWREQDICCYQMRFPLQGNNTIPIAWRFYIMYFRDQPVTIVLKIYLWKWVDTIWSAVRKRLCLIQKLNTATT